MFEHLADVLNLSESTIALMMVIGMSLSAQGDPIPGTQHLYVRGGGLIYDMDRNITWLQDANYSMTSGYDSDGRMTWEEAMMWASQLVYGGYDDWRLPTTIPLTTGSNLPDDYVNQTLSEMGHLFHIELGNTNYYTMYPLSPVNYGPFLNIVGYRHHWSSTERDVSQAFAFDFSEQAYPMAA